jgi:hypothetical protein
MPGWRPLSSRDADPSPDEEPLHEGVPPHLHQPLLHWVDTLFQHDDVGIGSGKFEDSQRRAGRIAARLRLDLRPVPARTAYRLSDNAWRASCALVDLADKSGQADLLDVVDATLADGVTKGGAQELERLLADGGSAWRVADDRQSLVRRVDPTATEAFRQAATGNAAPHLAAAWTAAYGRHPNPSRAYSEAIKAVEVACIPVVIPGAKGAKATLGRVIQNLNDHPQEWRLAIHSSGRPAEIGALLTMLRLLWQGQTDRHGGSAPTIPVTTEAAYAAVHLAVTLVQWFQSGGVQRISHP